MRLGLITSSYPISPDDTVNAGVFVRDLAKELVSLGNEVHVITPQKHGSIVPDPDISLHFIKWCGGEKDLASASMRNWLTLGRYATLVVAGVWQTSRLAYMLRLDALMAMWAIPSGLFAIYSWKKWEIPYGVWVLGSDIWARHKYPLGHILVRQILLNARFCFSDGVKLAEDASSITGKPCQFVPSARNLHALPRPLQLDSTNSHLLYIGRYEYNKGPDILIEAMRILLERGSRAYLHMFGTGSLENFLKQQASDYAPYITIGGFADPETCVSYMKTCDWLVIPSRIESIPLIFSDALQMKLPVIATDVGDLGELMRRYQVGKIVPAGDPVALANVLEQAIKEKNVRHRISFEQAINEFDIRRSALRCALALRKEVENN